MTLSLTINPEPSTPSPYQLKQPKAPEMVNNDFFGSFADVLDVINPLQHLPVISTLYRELTGDEISQGAKLAGNTLYGGAVGFFASLINSVIEQETGKDIGGNLYAAYKGAGVGDQGSEAVNIAT